MERYIDKLGYTFSTFTAKTDGLDVRCPNCGNLGKVYVKKGNCIFECSSCTKRLYETLFFVRYSAAALCKHCNRHFRVDIKDENEFNFTVLNKNCIHCGELQQCKVTSNKCDSYSMGEIEDGIEPFFSLPLFYQTSFKSKIIWAVNREHLVYLIDYLSADLREKPINNYGPKTQSYHLPAFMKTAKNRDGIVKSLKKLL